VRRRESRPLPVCAAPVAITTGEPAALLCGNVCRAAASSVTSPYRQLFVSSHRKPGVTMSRRTAWALAVAMHSGVADSPTNTT